MKKPITLIAVLLATLAPGGSRAGDACSVLHDPVGDVHPAWMPVSTGLGHTSDAIDLTGVQMFSDADSLMAVVGVRDLSAPLGPGLDGASYTVSWDAGERQVRARATRTADTWSYDWYDSTRASGLATGLVSGSTIAIELPLAAAANGAPGALQDIRAVSAEEATQARAGTNMDEAPNFMGGPRRFTLGGSCVAPTAGMGSSCEVLRAEPAEQPVQGSTDLRSVSFAAADQSLIAEIRVADLSAQTSGERWEVVWFNPRLYEGDEQQSAFAERTGQRVEFGYQRGYEPASATGSLDLAASVIRIVIPREHLSLLEGTRIKDVTAMAWVVNGAVGSSASRLPRGDSSASWIVGKSCSAVEVQVCPIVLDRRGDARYAEATDEVPENYAGLDLRAVGASPSDERVTLAARVEDLRAPDPPGAEVVGWTISWLDGDRRMYAQAERYAEGLVFRYGARKSEGLAPAGPTFAGTATTGRLNIAGNVVEIDVPRSFMPGDGTQLNGVGATAWGLSGRNSASVYLVWDETVARGYRTGVMCPA